MKDRNARKADKLIPALKYDWLTPLFDPLLRLAVRDAAFKRRLIAQAKLKSRQHILDLGCGTGTLALLVKRKYPDTKVTGLDGDPKILEIAERKVKKERLGVRLDRGMSFDLPYSDHSFDKVLSTLFFHHLTPENKLKTLREVFRVLRRGGELHVADWGRPQNRLMRALFLPVQLLDGFKTTEDNVRGRLPEFFKKAGFEAVDEKGRHATLFGTLSFYRARKPD